MDTRITNKDRRGFHLALKVAELSDCRYQIGSVIIKSGNVLSVGCNTLKSHTQHKEWPEWVCSQHAEFRAILKSRCDLRGATLYVARIGGKQVSKPCSMCNSAIVLSGIREVVYSNGKELVKIRVS